jgi:excisionase family DNA binding protein
LRTLVELTIVVVAVVGFTAVVLTFTRAGEPAVAGKRAVIDPDDPDWLDVDEAASYLGVEAGFILNLVERDAIPFFVMTESDSAARSSYYFRREELDEWTVG